MSRISAIAIAGTALVAIARAMLLLPLSPALCTLGLHLLQAYFLLGYALLPLLLHSLITWRARSRWGAWGAWGLPACGGRMLLHVLGAFGLNLLPAFFLLGFALFPFFVHRLATG